MKDNQDSAEEWMAISDLMSGLMLIFLLIAISFMVQVQKDKDKVLLEKEYLEKVLLENQLYKAKLEQISKEFAGVEGALNKAFLAEFTPEELEKWNVEILKDNTIRFTSPEILFLKGKSDLNIIFKFILEDFFPRYIKVLSQKQFVNHIEEIRIEGHTSSKWNSSKRESYRKNLQLSQERARAVLNFIINRSEVINQFDWLTSVFRANGLSSSKLIYDDNGKEDIDASRRVEFRVMTKSREALRKLEKLRLDMKDK